jgi:hypothetical protein
MFSILSFLLQLNRLQAVPRMSRDEIHALQEARWRRLLRYAHDHSSFYRERFHGLDLSRCRPADLAPLGKVEMMANFDALVTDRRIRRADVAQFIADPSNLGKSYLGRYAVCHTSGSEGQPALVVQERQDMLLGVQAQMVRGQDLPHVPIPHLRERRTAGLGRAGAAGHASGGSGAALPSGNGLPPCPAAQGRTTAGQGQALGHTANASHRRPPVQLLGNGRAPADKVDPCG